MYSDIEGNLMDIYDYQTAGGKNLITEYIDALPNVEKLELYEELKMKDYCREVAYVS